MRQAEADLLGEAGVDDVVDDLRYILDAVVEMKYDGLYNDAVLYWFNRLLPTPDASFLLDVTAEESLRRKDDTKEMLENLGRDVDAANYLQTRRKLYLNEADKFDSVVVDATQSESSVQSKVVSTALDKFFEF